MVNVGLCVPVLHNFKGFTELIRSVDIPVRPYIQDNWNDNAGVSVAWNRGLIEAADDGMEYLFICNDDIVFEKNTMRWMLNGIIHGYDVVTAFNTRDENYDTHSGPQYLDSPDFSCFVVSPKEFMDRFGHFDENFYPAYFEDNDMHYRTRLAGRAAVKSTMSPMFHRGSVTQNWNGGQVVTSPMFELNRAHYIAKWGGGPGEERFTNPFDDPEKDIKDW